jgi:hypothetical protein
VINTWYNIVGTFDPNNGMCIYKNGVLAESQPSYTGYPMVDSNNMGIGGISSDDTINFLGKIDELAIWKGTVLTLQQVKDIYNSGFGTYY